MLPKHLINQSHFRLMFFPAIPKRQDPIENELAMSRCGSRTVGATKIFTSELE
jgi:hypothetical protein